MMQKRPVDQIDSVMRLDLGLLLLNYPCVLLFRDCANLISISSQENTTGFMLTVHVNKA